MPTFIHAGIAAPAAAHAWASNMSSLTGNLNAIEKGWSGSLAALLERPLKSLDGESLSKETLT